MLNFLSNPAWQGIGVVITLVLGFIGFYYAGQNKLWLYSLGVIVTFMIGFISFHYAKQNKLWLYSSGVIVIFIIGFSVGTTIQPTSTLPPSNLPLIIPVDSTQDWQETGINLKKGNTVTINVVGGGWTMWRRKLGKTTTPGGELWEYVRPENTGEGLELNCSQCPIPKANLGSLIAKVINPENLLLIDTFVVGKEIRYTAPFDGLISLRINDTGLNDNAGILLTKIKVYP